MQQAPSKYHNINCCDYTIGIDNLLLAYHNDRNNVIDMIVNDPQQLIDTIWQINGPLAIDNECKCQMGKGDVMSSFACAQCKNIKRLTDFRIGGVEIPFSIQCGELSGTELIIAMSDILGNRPYLQWDDSAIRRAQNYYRQHPQAKLCGASLTHNDRCIVGDSFTIRTLILWTISRIFTDKGLPHAPMLHTAFVCHNVGYSLYNNTTIGSYEKFIEYYSKPIDELAIKQILMQLIVILKELQQINFTHGTPSIHGLIWNNEPVSYIYDGVHISAPFTLQITDLWNSSATLGNVHYYSRNIRTSFSFERDFFYPEIIMKQTTMAYCQDNVVIGTDKVNIACPIGKGSKYCTANESQSAGVCDSTRITFYKLTQSTINIYSAMRHCGFPLYSGSFDCYCFIVALMCQKNIFDCVIETPNLYRLWSMMWLKEDIIRIESLLQEYHINNDIVNRRANGQYVIEIIKNAWLRCDIIDHLWKLFKLGW